MYITNGASDTYFMKTALPLVSSKKLFLCSLRTASVGTAKNTTNRKLLIVTMPMISIQYIGEGYR